MSDTIAFDDLKSALNRLETHGWIRGAMVGAEGACCAVGAFGWPFPTESPGIKYLAQAAREYGGWRPPKDVSDLAMVIRFNDRRGRKFDDVVAIFKRAMDLALEAAL